MAVIGGLTDSFKQEILQGIHNLKKTGGNTIKVALYRSSADITPSTTAYTSSGEVTSTNYTAGGKAVTSNGIVSSGGVVYVDFADVEWTSAVTFTDSGGTDNRVRGALIYNDTASGDPSIAVLDFGLSIEVSSTTFKITFPIADVNDAIIRIK